jgi:hypothetical protein
MEKIPTDILNIILQPFQANEESFLVGLVCKQWSLLIIRIKGFTWKEVSVYYATHGRLSVLQWCQYDDLRTTIYLFRNHGYTKKYFEVGANATKKGHLEVVKWLHQNGLPLNSWTCRNAALSGNLELLQWARENGCNWGKEIFSNAATAGHLHILIWAKENGCPLYVNLCTTAVGAGNMEILMWAIENGFPLKESACTSAAHNANFKMLKFLYENGAPLNLEQVVQVIQEALLVTFEITEKERKNYTKIKEWLIEHYPNVDFTTQVYY